MALSSNSKYILYEWLLFSRICPSFWDLIDDDDLPNIESYVGCEPKEIEKEIKERAKQGKEVRAYMYHGVCLKSCLLAKIFIAYNGRKVFDKIVS